MHLPTNTIPSFPEPNGSTICSCCRDAYERALIVRISSMDVTQSFGAHSAIVKMRLIVNGSSIPITHMKPDFLYVDTSDDFPPDERTIVFCVDESERQWRVKLPEKVSKTSKKIPLAIYR